MWERLSHQKVVDLASDGYGVIRPADGPVVLVPFVLPGEEVDVWITRRKKQVWYGEVAYWHTRSSARVQPACADFGTCGGCRWQMIDYAAQLQYKKNFVQQAFHHIAKLPIPIPMPIPSPHIWHYRNKAEYAFGQTPQGELVVGFHPRGHFAKVLDLTRCQIVPPAFETIRKIVAERAKALHLLPYDPVRHTGLLRSLLVRGTPARVVVFLSLAEDRPEIAQELLLPLVENLSAIQGIGYFYNPKRNDSVHDLTPILLWGQAELLLEVVRRRYFIGPKDFFQVNLPQAENMVRWIAERWPPEAHTLYDLYGGVGFFSVALADKVKKIVLVEKLPEAVQAAERNFAENKAAFPQTTYEVFTGSVEALWDQAIQEGEASVAIIDPPREGLHPSVRRALARGPFKHIFYVSCHPATQARDVAELTRSYTIEAVQPFDLFPHTVHIENLLWLRRRF